MATTSFGSEETDRHGWNSLEGYLSIHDNRLNNHSFLDPSKPHTIGITYHQINDEESVMAIQGHVFCLGNVVLEVEKYLQMMERENGQLFVRGFSYRYHAFVPGEHSLVRYDNSHGEDVYHRHAFEPVTGQETEITDLTRNEFPTFSEILDELEEIYLESSSNG